MEESKVLEFAGEAAEAAIKAVEMEPKAGLSLAKKCGIVGVGVTIGAGIVFVVNKTVKKFKAKKHGNEAAAEADGEETEVSNEETK